MKVLTQAWKLLTPRERRQCLSLQLVGSADGTDHDCRDRRRHAVLRSAR